MWATSSRQNNATTLCRDTHIHTHRGASGPPAAPHRSVPVPSAPAVPPPSSSARLSAPSPRCAGPGVPALPPVLREGADPTGTVNEGSTSPPVGAGKGPLRAALDRSAPTPAPRPARTPHAPTDGPADTGGNGRRPRPTRAARPRDRPTATPSPGRQPEPRGRFSARSDHPGSPGPGPSSPGRLPPWRRSAERFPRRYRACTDVIAPRRVAACFARRDSQASLPPRR